MKLLTSPYSSSSPSSSSSSTFSFDPTFCSFKTAITTIFHRIICSGGLQTHPSEQIRELNSNFIASEKVQNLNTSSTIVSSSPVARLMGLDSMTSSSVSHSKSLNFVSQGFHLVENENFLVFSFESGGENSKFKSKGRRKEKGCVELKKKKREKVNVGNDGEFQFEKSLFMEDGNGEKVKKRKKGKICCVEKKIENECCSEDSSPVSVFDFEYDVSGTGLFLQFEFNFCLWYLFILFMFEFTLISNECDFKNIRLMIYLCFQVQLFLYRNSLYKALIDK
jgi:hypothetical protein